MTDGYDATAKLVNAEIVKLGDAGTFADLKTHKTTMYGTGQ